MLICTEVLEVMVWWTIAKMDPQTPFQTWFFLAHGSWYMLVLCGEVSGLACAILPQGGQRASSGSRCLDEGEGPWGWHPLQTLRVTFFRNIFECFWLWVAVVKSNGRRLHRFHQVSGGVRILKSGIQDFGNLYGWAVGQNSMGRDTHHQKKSIDRSISESVF